MRASPVFQPRAARIGARAPHRRSSAPRARRAAGRLQHPPAEVVDQAVILRGADERARSKQPVVRMPPLEQGLESPQGARRPRHERRHHRTNFPSSAARPRGGAWPAPWRSCPRWVARPAPGGSAPFADVEGHGQHPAALGECSQLRRVPQRTPARSAAPGSRPRRRNDGPAADPSAAPGPRPPRARAHAGGAPMPISARTAAAPLCRRVAPRGVRSAVCRGNGRGAVLNSSPNGASSTRDDPPVPCPPDGGCGRPRIEAKHLRA